MSAFHDRDDALLILQDADVLQRISVQHQQVSKEAWLDLPGLVFHAHQLRSLACGRNDRLHRREAEQFHEMLEILGVLADRIGDEGAIVAARQHAHAALAQITHAARHRFHFDFH